MASRAAVDDEALLTAIDHLTWCIECAALEYGGELKEQLDALDRAIDERRGGYDHDVLRASLPALREARQRYRANDYRAGASELIRVNRRWWEALWAARGRRAG